MNSKEKSHIRWHEKYPRMTKNIYINMYIRNLCCLREPFFLPTIFGYPLLLPDRILTFIKMRGSSCRNTDVPDVHERLLHDFIRIWKNTEVNVNLKSVCPPCKLWCHLNPWEMMTKLLLFIPPRKIRSIRFLLIYKWRCLVDPATAWGRKTRLSLSIWRVEVGWLARCPPLMRAMNHNQDFPCTLLLWNIL